MPKGEPLTNYQRGIVNRYYQHKDTIVATRLGEIISDLYLAETQKAQDKLWNRVETALASSKIEPKRYGRLLEKRDLEALAELVGEIA